MIVKDLMRSPVRTIREDASLHEAAALLSALQVSGLPVVNENGELAGIVTEQDIIKAVLPTYDDIVTTDGAIQSAALLENRVCEVRHNPVSTIMTSRVFTLSEDDTLLAAASFMILRRLKVLPVTRDNRVVGTVSRIDVLHCLLKEYAD